MMIFYIVSFIRYYIFWYMYVNTNWYAKCLLLPLLLYCSSLLFILCIWVLLEYHIFCHTFTTFSIKVRWWEKTWVNVHVLPDSSWQHTRKHHIIFCLVFSEQAWMVVVLVMFDIVYKHQSTCNCWLKFSPGKCPRMKHNNKKQREGYRKCHWEW